ncbi:hypothetical protein GGR51DRAFT_511995 [Nemania sp. FL0031]|nr:hypothetical protein GGR51DRAFT_511995 [Nemania sp. FL0031]
MNEISYEGIQYILQEFFQRFDEIFFFDLLNREVQSVRPSHRRKLVVIKAYDWSGPGIDGQFQVIYDYIDIWLRGGDKGHRYPFEYLICVLLHEMTHAYLGIFADEKDDKYDEHVADYKTHGTMFWMLLNFLLRRVFEVTRSEVVWDEILGEEARRFESVDKPRYRRFFEKILKIF